MRKSEITTREAKNHANQLIGYDVIHDDIAIGYLGIYNDCFRWYTFTADGTAKTIDEGIDEIIEAHRFE